MDWSNNEIGVCGMYWAIRSLFNDIAFFWTIIIYYDIKAIVSNVMWCAILLYTGHGKDLWYIVSEVHVRANCEWYLLWYTSPDSKVHGANMRPIWVGPMNLAIRVPVIENPAVLPVVILISCAVLTVYSISATSSSLGPFHSNYLSSGSFLWLEMRYTIILIPHNTHTILQQFTQPVLRINNNHHTTVEIYLTYLQKMCLKRAIVCIGFTSEHITWHDVLINTMICFLLDTTPTGPLSEPMLNLL